MTSVMLCSQDLDSAFAEPCGIPGDSPAIRTAYAAATFSVCCLSGAPRLGKSLNPNPLGGLRVQEFGFGEVGV